MAGKRLLVTGATGLLGSAVVRVASGRGLRVQGIVRNPDAADPGCELLAADLTDKSALQRAVEKAGPDLVIHCAAFCNVDECERAPETAHAVNVAGTAFLADALSGSGARLVYVSTDSVFDGTRGSYAETDTPNPVNVYARTKLEGEEKALALPRALVARTVFHGISLLPGAASLSEWILNRLAAGEHVPAFTDALFSPLFADHAAALLLDLADTNHDGVAHLGGEDAVSKHDFARAMARIFGYAQTLIRPAAMRDVDFHAPRPRNVTLNSSLAAAALGKQLPGMEDGIRAMRDRIHTPKPPQETP